MFIALDVGKHKPGKSRVSGADTYTSSCFRKKMSEKDQESKETLTGGQNLRYGTTRSFAAHWCRISGSLIITDDVNE